MHNLIKFICICIYFQLISTLPAPQQEAGWKLYDLSDVLTRPENFSDDSLSEGLNLPTYNATIKLLKLPRFRNFAHSSLYSSYKNDDKRIIKLDEYENYSTKINLRNEALFPSAECKSGETTCNVTLVPPTGQGIFIRIQKLNVRLHLVFSKAFQLYESNAFVDPSEGYKCKDYLQFIETTDPTLYAPESRKICGQLPAGSEAFIGSHYYIGEIGNNVTISFHHGANDFMDSTYGNTWNSTTTRVKWLQRYTNLESLDGDLLISSYNSKSKPETPEMPPSTTTTTTTKKPSDPFGSNSRFWDNVNSDNSNNRFSPKHSTTPSTESSITFLIDEPQKKSQNGINMTWILIVFVVVLLNVFGCMCRKMKKMEAASALSRLQQQQQEGMNGGGIDNRGLSRRISIPDGMDFANGSHPNSRHVPFILTNGRGQAIHTIVAVPPPPTPPPVYRDDLYLPSYESLFENNGNKNVPSSPPSVPAPPVPSSGVNLEPGARNFNV